MARWSTWRPFPAPPHPRTHTPGGILHAPFGPGVYDLRNARTGQPILFGVGKHCAKRMSSILPQPLGCSGRNNAPKRAYVLRHLKHIEYRTLACADMVEAREVEMRLKHGALAEGGTRYRFMT